MDELLNTVFNTPFSVIAEEAGFILDNIHFIRADWFYAFIPLVLYLFFYNKKTQNNKNWHSVVDRRLVPYVLTKSSGKRRRYPLLLILIATSLCITALAGPVYKKLPQPVYREQSSLVVLLDLSRSMNATDIKPSRLARAKLKLLDILKTRKAGQTALIVYAADAFVVTPLTDDNTTIANLVPSLETDMMPAQGSNLSKALAKTFSLFTQAGIIRGNILVITDDINPRYKTAIEKVSSQGHRLSIFGIGTNAGGPIPLFNSPDGGFLQDSKGAIVIPKLQSAKLQQYALAGSGIYTSLSANDNDIQKLTSLFRSKNLAENKNDQSPSSDTWQEEGHWLLLPLLFFAALWARKGWIAALLPFAITFISAIPQPAYAEGKTDSIDTLSDNFQTGYFDAKHLWSSPDQKAMKAFNSGDDELAAKQFTQPDWKASALYRHGDYEQAAEILEHADTSDGFYNKANALAQLGKYKEALTAYDKSLELNENNEDAEYNREQVKQALEEQQEQSEQESSDEGDSEQDNENKEKGDQGDEQQDDEENESSDSESKDGENQENSEQKPSDKNKDSDQQEQAEEKELEQRDADQEKAEEQKEQQQYEQDQKDQEQKDKNDQQSDSVENKESENEDSEEDPLEIEINPVEASITEEEKATEQWLKRIPDDPGGLLRRKFLYQYKQIPNQTDTDEPW
ncbi:MAG: VWA domain-containing protein [Gammaproteobacteria bacterium]|nr:VWA domain-containing protein [Gammaproteobacteria bacterium]